MLQSICIGYLGADAEVKSSNGKEFTTFRIAHTDKWTDEQQQTHENTIWVDCVLNGKPTVVEYLKRGTQVYITGSVSLRVYSSAKDRCMKAGMTINVRSIELLGGKTDQVPSILYRADNGTQVDVQKWFYAPSLVRDSSADEFVQLISRNNGQFVADRNGFIQPNESF